jgi:hypothetical protein
MTEIRAEEYDRQLRELEERQKHETVRIRGNGPHTRFRVHFKRALQYVELRGINKKTITLHTPKRVAFRQLRRLIGLDAQDLCARAEHRSSLAFVYGGRKASRTFKPEGGPDERKDMSMGKILANRSQRKLEFNRVPPHFSPEFIASIPFDKIVPCYQHLPANIVKLLPFLLAQLITHYHKDDGLALLGHDNPLMKSPLWSDASWILYRYTLHMHLQGGRNCISTMKSQLRDEHCDDFLMRIAQLKGQATLLESVNTEEASSEARAIRKLLAEIEGKSESISDPSIQQQPLSNVKRTPVSSASQTIPPGKTDVVMKSIQDHQVMESIQDHQVMESIQDHQESHEPQGIQQQITARHGQYMQLQQAPPAFRVPDVLDVRTAWFKFFALGCDKKGLWHSKTAQNIDPSVTGNERKNMRDHFNKAKKVIEMLVGSNSIQDIERLGTEHAFQLANAKVKQIWGQDIIGSSGGYKTVRSVYNIICGKGTSISSISCQENFLNCSVSPWKEPVELCQQQLSFAKQERKSDCAVASDHKQEDGDELLDDDIPGIDDDIPGIEHDESCDFDLDDTPTPATVLCFLCRECHEARLFPKFSRYLAHWQQHRSTCGDHKVQKPMEDEVWHMWAVKQGTHSTAKYVAQGSAFMPAWSKEQKSQFLRKRIIYRRILKKHDKLVVRQSDGSDAVVRVLDEGLIKKYKEWCIKSVVYLDPSNHAKLIQPKSGGNMVYINVTSVMDIVTCQTPTKLPSETSRSTPPQGPALMISPTSGQSHRFTPSRRHECDYHRKKLFFESEKNESLISTPQQPSKADIKKQNDQEICRIEAAINHATASNANALKEFRAANDRLEQSGWSRCQTLEGSGKFGPQQNCTNLRHPKYSVVEIPRDGHCLFHCFAHILNLKGIIKSHETVRKELHQYVQNQASENKENSFGGIYYDGTFLPLEESLGANYGGQMAVCAFMQVYDVKICIHRPETSNESQDCNDPKVYHILHTQSWHEWILDRGTYARNYAGDHWQMLQPDLSVSASKVSAPTAPKRIWTERSGGAETQKALFASETDSPSKRTRSSTQEIHASAVCFMLRAVSNSRKFLRNPTLDSNSQFGGNLRIFEISELLFLEHDYGDTFSRVYNSCVQQVLYAFPELDEQNRTFFIALGLGLNLDPFVLQFTFRSHAKEILKTLQEAFKSESQELENLMFPNREVSHKILKWCWPPEFDSVRLSIISQGQLLIFTTSDTAAKDDIVLKCSNRRYTFLHPIQGATVDKLMRKLKVDEQPLAHEQNIKLRCKRMNPFDFWSNKTIYLSASLEGSEPEEKQFKNIWNQAITECGLNYDENLEKWTVYPDGLKISRKSDTPGSMKASSWVKVQQKLLNASTGTLHQTVGPHTRQSLRSPPRASLHLTSEKQPPVVFVDAGSESGKGLYMMMTDQRIKHVAGIELQEAWFRASTRIFAFCRDRFRDLGYRMPEVTLINSDMMSQTPELKYLYSSAGIMWMNNYVFDSGDPYFAEKITNKSRPQPLVKSNPWLTDNAAFNFSNHFEGVTYIAVHKPAGFAPCWHYTHFKSFQVDVTWGNGTAAGIPEVTIIQHMQHISLKNLATGCCYKLCSPSQKDILQLEDLVQRWDALQPTLCTLLENEDPTWCRRDEIAKTGKDPIQINDDDEESMWVRRHRTLPALQTINAAVDDVVRQMTTRANLIEWTQFLSLTDKTWLPTDIIQAYVNLLQTEFDTVAYFNWTELRDHRDKTFLRHRDVQKLIKTRIGISFMNLSNVHWIAVKIDLIKNYIAIADSLFSTFQHAYKDIFARIAAVAKAIGHGTTLNCYNMQVPDQNNSLDCGVHTCLYMLYMSQNVSAHVCDTLLSDII